MRNALVLVGFWLLTSCATVIGGSERQAVLGTVQGFFDFIATRDPELGAEVLLPEGVFVTVRESNGKRQVRTFTNAQSIERMCAATPQMREAFVGEPRVMVEGNVATVWARYVFEIDGKLSHTGVDAFNLVRTEGGWKICGGAYTVIR